MKRIKNLTKVQLSRFQILTIVLIIVLTVISFFLGREQGIKETQKIYEYSYSWSKPIPAEKAVTFSDSAVHKNQSWLFCEQMVNGNLEATKIFLSAAPTDTRIAKARMDVAKMRMEMIKTSRHRYIRPQHAWGKRLTDSYGAKPNTVILYENGLAIYRKNRYSFFHKATLEIEPSSLTEKVEIAKGIDGFYYPAVLRDSNLIPLTYWGEIKKSSEN